MLAFDTQINPDGMHFGLLSKTKMGRIGRLSEVPRPGQEVEYS
jgi:hypothetical protein